MLDIVRANVIHSDSHDEQLIHLTLTKYYHMKLLSISLTNFKGVRDFTFKPSGANASLYGANESGKTTVADAFTWLLFGKDLQDRIESKFGIKTRDSSGSVIHDIEHSVSATFEHESRVFTLRRVYSEDWTRKRGSDVKELTGHTTSYFIDDAPVSKSEYQKFVDSIIDESKFKMLTVPNYFAETLDWKERRAILSEIVGDIDDLAVVASNDSLKDYMTIRGALTHDQAKDRIRAQSHAKKDALKTLPARIDEAERTLEVVEDADLLDVRRARIQEQIAETRARIEQTLSSETVENPHAVTVATIAQKLAELDEKKRLLFKEAIDAVDARRQVLRNQIDSARDEQDTCRADISRLSAELNQLKENEKATREAVERHATHLFDETCPSCGQALQADKVSSARNEHAEILKRLESYHSLAKMALDDSTLEERIATLQKRYESETTRIASLIEQRDAIFAYADTTSLDNQIATLTKDLEDARSWFKVFAESNTVDKSALTAQDRALIVELESELSKVDKQKQALETNAKTEQRIEELRTLRELTASELVKLEQDLLVLEAFERIKSDLITSAVNSRFKSVEFILFRDQINGGLAPCCDVVFKGVPYSEGLNTAGRAQAGIEIISVLAEHFGVTAPIIVDNRESVTSLPETSAQVISLVVSPEHKTLTHIS